LFIGGNPFFENDRKESTGIVVVVVVLLETPASNGPNGSSRPLFWKNGSAHLLFGGLLQHLPHRTSTPTKKRDDIHRPDWGQKRMLPRRGRERWDGPVVVVFRCCWFITHHRSLVWMI
jgi:hypothetical protein